jgi:hypothetical protein
MGHWCNDGKLRARGWHRCHVAWNWGLTPIACPSDGGAVERGAGQDMIVGNRIGQGGGLGRRVHSEIVRWR